MAGLIVRGNFPRRLLPGVKEFYGQMYGEWPKEFMEYMNVDKSDRAYEDYVSMAGMGLPMVKDEGASMSYDDVKQGIATRLIPVVYTKGFIISHEAQADDLYDPKLVSVGSAAAARSMVQGKEIICANVLNNAFTAPSPTNGDGLSLGNSAHLLAKSTSTFSNVPSSPADLSEAALEQMNLDLSIIVDDANLKIPVHANKLLITENNRFIAERILKSPLRVATADNDLNALKSIGTVKDVAVLHFLSNAQPYFVTTDKNTKESGLILLERESVELDADSDFDTKSDKFSIVERFAVGAVDPRAIYCVNAP